jgi:aldehyde:ferredoxin oxidoreductase
MHPIYGERQHHKQLKFSKQELGDSKIEIAQCGPAGEKLCRMAAIINMNNRANGRTGMGAVMGSKNLKAVVVRGKSKRLNLADPTKVAEIAKQGIRNLQFVPGLQKYGTAEIVAGQHLSGGLPTFNFNQGQFDQFEEISGERMVETILKEADTCYACAVRCKRVVETEWNGLSVKPESGGPEYETLSTLGSYCGVGDLQAISYANQLCNEYGLDTISTGATVAWAMECFQEGVLSESEIGRPLPFGDAAGMVAMVQAIALREGIGNILAEGTERAARLLGKGSEYLITSKGTETPAHMPQVKRSLGLIYAVNPFGADHQSSEHDPMVEEGASQTALAHLAQIGIKGNQKVYSFDYDKLDFAYKTQVFYSFLDTANLCQIIWGPATDVFEPKQAVELIQAVTGWTDFNMDELMTIGERRINMMRVFNQREGLNRANDRLPKKFFNPLGGKGPSAGFRIDEVELENAKTIYYNMAGWDQNGLPTSEKLDKLGISWIRNG